MRGRTGRTDISKFSVLEDDEIQLLGQPHELVGESEGEVGEDVAVCLLVSKPAQYQVTGKGGMRSSTGKKVRDYRGQRGWSKGQSITGRGEAIEKDAGGQSDHSS